MSGPGEIGLGESGPRESGVSLRPAGPGDVEALARVHAEAWRAGYGHLIPAAQLARFGLEQRRLLWHGLLVESARPPLVEVALEAGTLAGFVWSRRIAEPGAPYEAEIVALNVHPEHWRRGIGRRLMAAAAARQAGLGAGSLYLWVFRDNAPGRAFYDSLEGRIVDRDVERFGELALPTLAYAWKPLSRLVSAVSS